MTKAIRISRTGGPEVLEWQGVDVAGPGQGEVRIRQTAVGVNYIDTYHRSGLYPVPLPAGLGVEAAGIVDAVGAGVENFHVGERVAYAGGVPGAYAQTRLVPAGSLVHVPETISDEQAAAILLQGMTAYYLIHRTYAVKPGDTVLWHAAAGGVGLIACQWLKAKGVTVIGTVGSEEKAELARAHGCHHTILYRSENVPERVRELTNGAGVPVVFDSVGKDTWDASIDSLQPLGLMVSFGNASGAVPPFNIGQLAAKGSLYVTRPVLASYVATREDLDRAAGGLFEAVRTGTIRPAVSRSYALKDAAIAHTDLEARRTTGSIILRP
jgi:NADPH2:quinone reductase